VLGFDNVVLLLGVRMESHKYSMPLVSWRWETQNGFKVSSLLPRDNVIIAHQTNELRA